MTSNMWKIPHTSPWQVTDEVYFVSIYKKKDDSDCYKEVQFYPVSWHIDILQMEKLKQNQLSEWLDLTAFLWTKNQNYSLDYMSCSRKNIITSNMDSFILLAVCVRVFILWTWVNQKCTVHNVYDVL